MASRIVKQPNGKYARFSSIVDNFTNVDMTKEEAIALCQDSGLDTNTAQAKVQRAEIDSYLVSDLDPPGKGLIARAPGTRWEECISIVAALHGVDAALAIIHGDKTGAWDGWPYDAQPQFNLEALEVLYNAVIHTKQDCYGTEACADCVCGCVGKDSDEGERQVDERRGCATCKLGDAIVDADGFPCIFCNVHTTFPYWQPRDDDTSKNEE